LKCGREVSGGYQIKIETQLLEGEIGISTMGRFSMFGNAKGEGRASTGRERRESRHAMIKDFDAPFGEYDEMAPGSSEPFSFPADKKASV